MMNGWFTVAEEILRIGEIVLGTDFKKKSTGGDIHMWLLSVTETWLPMSGSEVFVTPTGGFVVETN